MYARRRRVYFLMMGGCLFLFVSAWAFVRLWSIPAAVAMCVVAMVIPPVAAIVANRRGPEDRWWDDPSSGSRASGSRPEGSPPDLSRPPKSPPPASRPRSPQQAPTGDPTSDRWWDELDGRDNRR
ncbi:DUF3099 domain-containing protein [Streptomyces sp. JH34]|uniref:DUF3099 domain-containing protein n=1 Tax=Streptomyces sp. JH34 TaxID=2793633 RepID=UPI0023F74B0F|nr:DUF3099 domain-containing protein [Streptomyces sp. JH34]MDF6019737.1 DUF3099 domain-containing protein [Streptomyces sp. JH34]